MFSASLADAVVQVPAAASLLLLLLLQKLATARGKDFEKLVMGYINDPGTNLVVAVTVSLLSTHSEDEQLLDEENTLLTVRVGNCFSCVL